MARAVAVLAREANGMTGKAKDMRMGDAARKAGPDAAADAEPVRGFGGRLPMPPIAEPQWLQKRLA